MKFPLSWLRDWLDCDASPERLAETMTMIGLEVEEVADPAAALAPFRVARVLAAERHPRADKLQVLTVDAGEGPVQVVCGAPNARAGMLGVFGPPGAYIPGSGLALKVAAIRGVESRGMMCSARELELGEDRDGIIELPGDAPVGAPYASYAGLDDPVFDVGVTPNRPDCMGVDGIARDLAAAGLGSFRPRPQAAVEGRFGAEPGVTVDPQSGCRVFWRRLIRGVRNGPSPDWLQRRLKAAGLRPISALVDVTNFFALDQARPLHVYDVAKLNGSITVRRGRPGDRFLALNGRDYEPAGDDCVIADESGAIGLGGIIGGERTGVDENTTDVLVECAWFDPLTIARTGQHYGITSDARSRFERGVDPMKLSSGIEAATRLILDLCGGEPSEPAMSGSMTVTRKRVKFDPAHTRSLAGLDVAEERQRAILTSLGFELEDGQALVPTWRPDVDGPADLVEEIARITGYDQVPATPLPRAPGVARPTATRSQLIERRVRRTAAACGLDEAVTWSFISEKEADVFGGGRWILKNPISDDLKVMRPSLLPGLLSAARRNLDRGAETVRLFELGRRYLADGEHPTLVCVLAGERAPRSWQSGKAQPFNAFDAKALCLELLDVAGAPVDRLQVMGDAGPAYHPGQSATLRLGPNNQLASFGMIHPAILKAFDIDVPVAALGIHLDSIPGKKGAPGFARPAYGPPALQAVHRDFAFLVPADLPAETLLRAIRAADKAAIAGARLFDRFETADGLSLAVEVTLQPVEKSFTDEDMADVSARIVAAAGKLGARLRSQSPVPAR